MLRLNVFGSPPCIHSAFAIQRRVRFVKLNSELIGSATLTDTMPENPYKSPEAELTALAEPIARMPTNLFRRTLAYALLAAASFCGVVIGLSLWALIQGAVPRRVFLGVAVWGILCAAFVLGAWAALRTRLSAMR